jgi:hypothetical protein
MIRQLSGQVSDAVRRPPPGLVGGRPTEASRKYRSGRIGGRPTEAYRKPLRGGIGRYLTLPGGQGLLDWRDRVSEPTLVPVRGDEVLP